MVWHAMCVTRIGVAIHFGYGMCVLRIQVTGHTITYGMIWYGMCVTRIGVAIYFAMVCVL